ncbi:hypothetical protein VTI74DRAFT_8166 [Chaetomium olivicolor]
MPMFREDDLEQAASPRDSASHYSDSAPIPIQTPPGMGRWLGRRLSEESIRTELCEGPIPESPPRPPTPHQAVSHAVSDRAELIERLKRGESPTWIPNRHLESIFYQNKTTSPPRTPQPAAPASPGLLPAPAITPEKQDAIQCQQGIDCPLQAGLNIGRPRSALHSGNFTPVEQSPGTEGTGDSIRRNDEDPFQSSGAAWIDTSPPRDFAPFRFARGATSYRREAFKTSGPSSLSSSLSSSFVYHPPTSPLVQSEVNEELDLTLPLNSFNIDANSARNPRRHTLNFAHSPLASSVSHRQPSIRRESTYPYQAHQPRRSLNSTPSFSFTGTPPQTPAFLRSRRPSITSDASPLHHASMVGSYEESILRGRMSTTPSKPLEFLAQIGVLGLGKCKASLRCPPHVTLPFSAVFYSYASTTYGRTKMDDGPSPYVGQIDLENGLPNLEEGQRAKRKLQSRYQDRKMVPDEPPAQESPAELSEIDGASKSTKQKRHSRSPKAPPGGGYRIPEKGQLQIIIKNQNKTAVKLFLVPYDLAGMEPGTKTFIRQRSYSAGPIIEDVKDAPANTDTDRPTLRYLIHLHICCPSKGRYYLYKSIRVVFANRVPDGKERLRNEVTYPDPRFSPYKPIRVMHPPVVNNIGGSNTPAPALTADKAFRRRSAGFSFGNHGHGYGHHLYAQHHHHLPALDSQHNNPPPPAIPFDQFPRRPEQSAETGTALPGPTRKALPDAEMTDLATPTLAGGLETYDKLNKGDVGYGGNTFLSDGTRTSTAAEGLLSKRLRSLGVVQQPQPGGAIEEGQGAEDFAGHKSDEEERDVVLYECV